MRLMFGMYVWCLWVYFDSYFLVRKVFYGIVFNLFVLFYIVVSSISDMPKLYSFMSLPL